MNKKPYPKWVCRPCGIKASKGAEFTVSTYHVGICGVCGQKRAVTQPRDFYYPDFKPSARFSVRPISPR